MTDRDLLLRFLDEHTHWDAELEAYPCLDCYRYHEISFEHGPVCHVKCFCHDVREHLGLTAPPELEPKDP